MKINKIVVQTFISWIVFSGWEQDMKVAQIRLKKNILHVICAHSHTVIKKDRSYKKNQLWDTFGCGVKIAFVSAAEYLLSQMGRPPSLWWAGAQVWRRGAFFVFLLPWLTTRQKTCSWFPHRKKKQFSKNERKWRDLRSLHFYRQMNVTEKHESSM